MNYTLGSAGDLELSTERYELRHLGEPVHLEPRVFETLAYLVTHRDRVVSKDELVASVWKGEHVTDSALARAVREVRRALRAAEPETPWVETVYGRGYRFVATVGSGLRDGGPPPVQTRGPAVDRSEPEVRAGRGESPPLLGRDAEWRTLDSAVNDAAAGRALLAMVAGEAGIGKTRLLEELRNRARGRGLAVAEARCYAAEGGLAFGPVAEWLRSPALAPGVEALDPVWRGELARLLPELATGGAGSAEPPGPETGRRRLFEALARAVLAGEGPLLLLLDDVQWSDADTLAWIHYLLRSRPTAPVLVATTVRTGEGPEGPGLSTFLESLRREDLLVEVRPGPLEEAATAELAERLLGHPLSPAAVRSLHRETEGNPLFVVESLRAGWLPEEAGRAPLPRRVQEVIDARLRNLSEGAWELAGFAAVLGREVEFPLLAAASPRPEDAVVRDLEELTLRGIVRERGLVSYDFTHDRVREVCLGTLSAARRGYLHRRAAEALEARAAGRPGAVAARLAAHWEHAGELDRAVRRYLEAARVARERFADSEAARLVKRGLELLQALPADARRMECELELRVLEGASLVSAEGYGGARVRRAFSQARELTDRLGRPPRAPVLRALAIAALSRSALSDALGLGEELAALGDAAGGDDARAVRVEAGYVLGVTRFWMGELDASRALLEEALERHDPADHRAHIALFSQDPGVVCGCRLALTIGYQGHIEEARNRCRAALAEARRLGHRYSLAYALNFAAWLAWDLEERQPYREWVRELSSVVEAEGLLFFEAVARVLEGRLEAAEGRVAEGHRRMHQGLDAQREMEQGLFRPFGLSLLAEACLAANRPEEGLDAVAEALEIGERTGELFREPELLRLRAELLALRGAPQREMEEALRRALEIARRQGSRMLERRLEPTWRRLSRADFR